MSSNHEQLLFASVGAEKDAGFLDGSARWGEMICIRENLSVKAKHL